MISINARPSYWDIGHTREKYLHRLSARIRGEEVVEYLGGKFNATSREKDDVLIFIKPRHLQPVKDGDYVDVLDDLKVIPHLKKHPKIKVIAMSQVHYNYLKKELDNEITLIPHHHINFERQKRTRNKTLVGGIIGSPSKAAYEITDQIKSSLVKIGVDFTTCFNYQTRPDMVDYYKKIDFLVIFNLNLKDRGEFYRHPAKIINAASFGIPSLAQPIAGYQEMEGFYIPIETAADIVREVEKLKDKNYYNRWSKKLINEAEKYHISNTSKLYLNL
ncbi:MAG: hypothetical protein Q7R49_06020 [Candidatus Daviesbacteria bacterium]|nr:hypothetical protein [Candidatus Daviesbacteria bacterium]